jgi:hypothetical protein
MNEESNVVKEPIQILADKLEQVLRERDEARAEALADRASLQMCVGAAGIGDASELCGWIDGVRSASVMKDAAIRELIASAPHEAEGTRRAMACLAGREALSSKCGEGWCNPEEYQKLEACCAEMRAFIEQWACGCSTTDLEAFFASRNKAPSSTCGRDLLATQRHMEACRKLTGVPNDETLYVWLETALAKLERCRCGEAAHEGLKEEK